MTESQSNSCPVFLIVDDHEMIVEGTISTLKQGYPEVDIITCKTAQEAKIKLQEHSPDLTIIDLSIPETADDTSQLSTGIQLLKDLLATHAESNFLVQSAHIKTLIRIKPSIDAHQGGFTIVDKSDPKQDMLSKADWALQGIVYTPPEMRKVLEVKPEWIQVLKFAFEDCLQDKEIAQKMHVRERTVRNYWTKIQNALGVHPEEGVNTRIRTGARAKERGLID